MTKTDAPLNTFLLALADDELIQGHRLSEWCGHAPLLEEDIAFANLALDEIGHASLWYAALAGELGEDPQTYPDRLVYLRGPADYRSAPFVELDNTDWAFSMLRQYLFDQIEAVRLPVLAASGIPALAEPAAKILREEHYHLRHTRTWCLRLAQGTPESSLRMQNALETLWPYALHAIQPMPGQTSLAIDHLAGVHAAWTEAVQSDLTAWGLNIPRARPIHESRFTGSQQRATLLAELQSVARQHPGAIW